MSQSTQFGQFAWHELMTSDPEGAIKFYGEVVGWGTERWGGDSGGMDYRMWMGKAGPVGGVMAVPEPAAKMGVGPHWTCNVTVSDADATAELVKSLGGTILSGPESMPSIGRFVVFEDPHGARIIAIAPEGEMSARDPEGHGHFGWGELITDNNREAFDFYAKVFGWEKQGSMDMGPMGEYILFGYNGKQIGGMMNKPAGAPMPSSWLYYIHVHDFDAALERAKASGAVVCHGPMPVPGGGRIVQLTDPQGAATALLGSGATSAA